MKISGFTFVRNGVKLYYPVKESIMSILDLVDEFVVAMGDNDPDDKTREEIESIGSDKIKIIDTVWDLEKYPRGMEHAHQTDIAKEACNGDWLFYLQTDELIHESSVPLIKSACEKYLNNKEVEGFLFKYIHFWGDYWHYHKSHLWYPREIRIVRNDPEIHSWQSAQSFRRIPDFDGVSYRKKAGTYKLKVIELDAHIYHYGWVRPPEFMVRKRKYFNTNHFGAQKANETFEKEKQYFDYGPLGKLREFKGTHPAAMQPKIESFNWSHQLNYTRKHEPGQPRFAHDQLRPRILSFFENNFLPEGKQIGGFHNYIKLGKESA
jgi:hypothetical protein